MTILCWQVEGFVEGFVVIPLLRSLAFLNGSITGSLTFLEKKTSQYALPINSTLSDKPKGGNFIYPMILRG